MNLTVFQAYRVITTKRDMDLLFRGHPKNSSRLWFTELDPPYGDVFLRPRHIKSVTPIGPNRRQI
jgi:hypothetical protein